MYSNYASFIKRAEIRIFEPAAVLQACHSDHPVDEAVLRRIESRNSRGPARELSTCCAPMTRRVFRRNGRRRGRCVPVSWTTCAASRNLTGAAKSARLCGMKLPRSYASAYHGKLQRCRRTARSGHRCVRFVEITLRVIGAQQVLSSRAGPADISAFGCQFADPPHRRR